jgi:two-component system, LytTR family, sensor kinase
MPRFFQYRLDHIIFWTLTIGFHAYTRLPLMDKAGASQFILELILRNGLLACAIYLTILVAIPRLTQGNKIMGMLYIGMAIAIYIFGKNMHDAYFEGPARSHFFHNTFYNLSIVTFYLAFATTLHLSKQWFLQREQLRKIEIEKLNTELEYLRAQINPHFLFNSINTIYFQIDKHNNAARETLEKFSEMLRYQLYECSGSQIEIEKEVNYLRNYIDLQQLRIGNSYSVQFQTTNLKGFSIPPLLFMPLIENTFKHVSHYVDQPNEIKIEFTHSASKLNFTCFNTSEHIPVKLNGGIGLKNVRRRLELLYGKDYSLQIDAKSNTYQINLQIPVV